MNANPLVSIIIPVYNGENYMRQAIDSALNQTYKNIEVIVVNDGSKDKTDEIALSYGDKIRYFKKENGGVSSALNKGIAEMKGEYFSWLSHDDMYTPDKVEKSVLAIDYCKDENTLIYCASMAVDKDLKPLKKKKFSDQKKYLLWQEALMESLTTGAYAGCNFLIPKKAFDECGGFNENLRFIQDTVMWEKLFLNGFSLLKIPEVCVKYRIHGGQLTQTGRAIFKQEAKDISYEVLPQFLKISTKENNFLKPYAINCAKGDQKQIVKNIIKSANEHQLFSLLDKVEIFAMGCYGMVRPFIRKMYYKFFRKIKTS